jgi:hypothetical protein
MAVFTSHRLAEPRTRRLPSRVCTASDRESSRQVGFLRVEWSEWGRSAARMAGLALVALGALIGLGAVWVQLARALPLGELLHHPRALRAIALAGGGVGLLLLGRRRRTSRRRGRTLSSAVAGAVAAAVLTAGAGPARAVDATGTWSGNASCRQQAAAGVARAERRDSTLRITQRGGALFIAMDGATYWGQSEDSRRSPTRARGTVLRCTDDGRSCPANSGVLALEIKIDEARRRTWINAATKAAVRGGRHCRYRFRRTSRTDPCVGRQPEPEASACPTTCEPLDVSGHWEGTWASAVTGESGSVIADLSHEGDFVFGPISFPPFGDGSFSSPLLRIGSCAPAEFSSAAILASGIIGTLNGVATTTSMAGTWRVSDGSDGGSWQVTR